MKTLVILLALGGAVCAIPWPGPEPTQRQELDPRGWTPKPTQRPVPRASFPLLDGVVYPFIADLAVLGERQLSSKNPNTCGFIAGFGGEALTCDDYGYACISDYNLQAYGCCATSLASCYLHTACRNYAQGCGGCTTDINLLYCSEETQPYCITNYLAENQETTLANYACGIWEDLSQFLSDSSTVPYGNPLYTSALNSIGKSWSATFFGTTSSSSISSVTTFPPAPGPTTPPSPDNGGSSNGNASGGGSSSNSSSSAEGSTTGSSSSSGSSTPIGAIVGGVVGGVVVLAALAFAIWFFCIRKKRNQHNYSAPPQTSQLQHPNNYPPPGQQQGGPVGAQPPYAGAGYNNYSYPQPPQAQSPGQQHPLMTQGSPTVGVGSPSPSGPYQPPYSTGEGKQDAVVSEIDGLQTPSPHLDYHSPGVNTVELGGAHAQPAPPYQGNAYEMSG